MSDAWCPVCGEEFEGKPRQKWCSQTCRQAVYRAGGAEALAELKLSWARFWEKLAPRIATAGETAEKLRKQAAILRAI